MAEENEEVEGEEEGESGGGLKAILLPVIVSAITAAIVGAVFVFVLAPQPDSGGDALEQGIEQAASGPSLDSQQVEAGKQTGIFHNYDPFIVSIFDREKVHYLKVVLSLELANEQVKEEILAKNPKIRDAMIFVLSDFTLRELLDNQAKALLKEVMVKTLNKILGKNKVINVYFSEFTIQ
ncbi:MAG: flagellar basal body-associated FliL family protein [Deltaproteobacteria bacterium]|nr:flagellar basal body-associated FliL family protein [Deltaproteobacteria bacterium]